jgi:hypothetical protein
MGIKKARDIGFGCVLSNSHFYPAKTPRSVPKNQSVRNAAPIQFIQLAADSYTELQ